MGLLGAGLHKLTGLGNNHDAARLDGALKGIGQKSSSAHTVDMINHELDRERMIIVGRHAAQIHHGSATTKGAIVQNHPFRAASVAPGEIARVNKNFVNVGAHLARIPGFGGRFDAAEHNRRIKAIKPGRTPFETLQRYNAEFDWERRNMLQVHVTPQPRPPQLPAAKSAVTNHPYRADHLLPSEVDRVRKNLAVLSFGLSKITGLRSTHDPKVLQQKLQAIRKGHTHADTLKLANHLFDAERAAIVWPHATVLAHGGQVMQNHMYRVSSAEPHEVARVRKNIGNLSAGLAKVPGFNAGKLADLDKNLKGVSGKGPDAVKKINTLFDKERGALLNVHPKKDAKPAPHPYRASKPIPAEIDRVRKNLALLSSGLARITGLKENHNPAKHEKAVKGVGKKFSPEHQLDLINHEFDRERMVIVAKHAGVIHHGTGPGSKPAEKNNPFRAASTAPAEIARVKKNLSVVGARLAKLPGFGKRFDGAAMEKRLKEVKPAGTPHETLARYNAEFDWERRNMLQVHATPRPRPKLQPAFKPPPPKNHAYRVDHLAPQEFERVKKNLAALSQQLSLVTGIKSTHNVAFLDKQLKTVRPGHGFHDQLQLVNHQFDIARAIVVWPHAAVLAHGGQLQVNHTYRVSNAAPAEVQRARANIGKLSAGLAKVPGFGPVDHAELDKQIKAVDAKKPDAVKKINALLDKERAKILNVHPKKDAKETVHPYRAMKPDAKEVDRVRKNLALLSAGLAKVTGLKENHDAAKHEKAVKAVSKKSTPAHTLDMINLEFDRERTVIVGKHLAAIHHGTGPASHSVVKNNPFRASNPTPAEIARVKKNVATMGLRLSKTPGFGKRFNAAEFEKRLKAVPPGKTPAETVARYNAEFDWERRNMLQVHVVPKPRPVHGPAAKPHPAGAKPQPAGAKPPPPQHGHAQQGHEKKPAPAQGKGAAPQGKPAPQGQPKPGTPAKPGTQAKGAPQGKPGTQAKGAPQGKPGTQAKPPPPGKPAPAKPAPQGKPAPQAKQAKPAPQGKTPPPKPPPPAKPAPVKPAPQAKPGAQAKTSPGKPAQGKTAQGGKPATPAKSAQPGKPAPQGGKPAAAKTGPQGKPAAAKPGTSKPAPKGK
jgi:hypothetical protein